MKTSNSMQLKAYIRNRAREAGITPQLMMQNYLLERLLERISLSNWRDSIVIKGGVLISSLVGNDRRTTYNLDTTVRGFPLTHESAEKTFREISAIDANDDFVFDFVRTEDIRGNQRWSQAFSRTFSRLPPESARQLTASVTTRR